MISSVSDVGGSPLSSSAAATTPRRPGSANWRADRLTFTRRSGRAWLRCHALAWRQASWITQRPIDMISPVSSARAMKSPGIWVGRPVGLPANERLEPDDVTGVRSGAELDDRLVLEAKLAPLGGAAEPRVEVAPGGRLDEELRVEQADPAAPAGLRRIHRDVRVSKQVVGRVAGRSQTARRRCSQRSAARPDPPRPAPDRLSSSLLGDGHRLVRAVDVLEEDGELVTTEARRRVTGTDRQAKALGEGLQDLVARRCGRTGR